MAVSQSPEQQSQPLTYEDALRIFDREYDLLKRLATDPELSLDDFKLAMRELYLPLNSYRTAVTSDITEFRLLLQINNAIFEDDMTEWVKYYVAHEAEHAALVSGFAAKHGLKVDIVFGEFWLASPDGREVTQIPFMETVNLDDIVNEKWLMIEYYCYQLENQSNRSPSDEAMLQVLRRAGPQFV